MYEVFAFEGMVLMVATLAMFAVKAWAFIDALVARPDAFVAADKMTKKAWLVILGLSLAAHMLMWGSPIGLLNIIGTVASLVYLVDVRPAVRSLTRN